MRVSHRDVRVTREIHLAAWGMLGIAAALILMALYFPIEAERFAAVVGLAAAGAAYVWRAGVAVQGYLRDVDNVAEGREVPGNLRVEVESSVAVRGRAPSPHVRRRLGRVDEEPPDGERGARNV